jgi:hypothetical protein
MRNNDDDLRYWVSSESSNTIAMTRYLSSLIRSGRRLSVEKALTASKFIGDEDNALSRLYADVAPTVEDYERFGAHIDTVIWRRILKENSNPPISPMTTFTLGMIGIGAGFSSDCVADGLVENSHFTWISYVILRDNFIYPIVRSSYSNALIFAPILFDVVKNRVLNDIYINETKSAMAIFSMASSGIIHKVFENFMCNMVLHHGASISEREAAASFLNNRTWWNSDLATPFSQRTIEAMTDTLDGSKNYPYLRITCARFLSRTKSIPRLAMEIFEKISRDEKEDIDLRRVCFQAMKKPVSS